jgi:hypothetical protein
MEALPAGGSGWPLPNRLSGFALAGFELVHFLMRSQWGYFFSSFHPFVTNIVYFSMQSPPKGAGRDHFHYAVQFPANQSNTAYSKTSSNRNAYSNAVVKDIISLDLSGPFQVFFPLLILQLSFNVSILSTTINLS